MADDFNWQQGGKGALGGAAAGGAYGGVPGAIIGGVAGGLIGGFGGGGSASAPAPRYSSHYKLPDFQHQYNRYGQLGQQYAGRQAPQANPFSAGYSGFRNQQFGLGRMLGAEAQGQGVGQQVVRMQAQDAADRAASQQMAFAAGARPGQGAQAYQTAAMNAGNAQSQVGGQAAMAGAQMQLGAMNQYGQFLQGARGADEQLGMFNAGQRQQSSQFNADAQLRMYGLNDQAQLEALRQRLAASQMQQQGGLAYAGHLAGFNQQQAGQPGLGDQLLGFGGGAASAAFARAGSQGAPAPQQPRPNYGHGSVAFDPFRY